MYSYLTVLSLILAATVSFSTLTASGKSYVSEKDICSRILDKASPERVSIRVDCVLCAPDVTNRYLTEPVRVKSIDEILKELIVDAKKCREFEGETFNKDIRFITPVIGLRG